MASRSTSPQRPLSPTPVPVTTQKSPATASPPSPKSKGHKSPSNTVRPLRRNASTSANEILKDGYDHKKPLTVKTKNFIEAGHNFTVNSKFSVKLDKSKKGESGSAGAPNVSLDKGSWLRLTTDANRFTFDIRAWLDGRFKLAWDAGYLNNGNDALYGLFRSNSSLTKWKAGLGVLHNLDQGSYITARVRVDEGMNPYLDGKLLYNYNKIRFFESIAFNVTTHQWPRYNSFLGYFDRDFDAIIAHESLKPTLQLGRLVASLVHRRDKYSFCAQLRVKNQKSRFIFGLVAPVNENVTLKTKIDDRLKLTTNGKFKVNKNISLGLTAQIRLAQGKDAFNFNNPLPVPLGVTIDANFP